MGRRGAQIIAILLIMVGSRVQADSPPEPQMVPAELSCYDCHGESGRIVVDLAVQGLLLLVILGAMLSH